jgi:creatinine amidohydrolase/Fe(II)-dependent formamide hydrolase-like protein
VGGKRLALRSLMLEDLTWPEIKDAVANGTVSVLLPVGSTEQHGPHLPLATDSLHTAAMLEAVGRRIPALVAPLLPIGRADHHMAFPGTISLRQETLVAFVRDCCASLAHHGFRNVLIYSGHGGNAKPLAAAISEIQSDLPNIRIIGCTDWSIYDDTLFQRAAELGIDRVTAGGHSGELETSMILALRPDLVLMDRAEPGYMGDLEAVRSKLFEEGIQAVTSNGVLGDPRPGDARRGREYLDAMIDRLTGFFQSAMGNTTSLSFSRR